MKRQSLGQLIKMYRKKAGLTQEELGEKVGAKNTYISRLENGHVTPSENEVRAIALELGQKPGYFIDRLKEESDGAETSGSHGRRGGGDGGGTEPTGNQGAAEGSDDDGGDLPPWKREDGWQLCERRRRRGLGTSHVTIRSDGGVYLSADLVRASGLENVEQVSLWKRDGAGGLESDPVGDYALGNDGGDSGVKVSGTHFRDWASDGSIRAPVTGYGDGWVAFERPGEGA